MDPTQPKPRSSGIWMLIFLGVALAIAIGSGIVIQWLALGEKGVGCLTGGSIVMAGIFVLLTINKFLRTRTVGWAYIFVVLLLLPAAILIFLVIVPMLKARAFNRHVPEYRAAQEAITQGAPAYTRGKLVVVDAQENKLDVDLMGYLPSAMRAKSADDVEMIVWEDCEEESIGRYGTAGYANIWICRITLVDPKNKVVAGETKVFRGGEPPKSSKYGMEQTGSKPTLDMVKYLESLPRK